MASPDDELFVDFIRFTYDMEPEIIVASDLGYHLAKQQAHRR
jgi:hypothetical protein